MGKRSTKCVHVHIEVKNFKRLALAYEDYLICTEEGRWSKKSIIMTTYLLNDPILKIRNKNKTKIARLKSLSVLKDAQNLFATTDNHLLTVIPTLLSR